MISAQRKISLGAVLALLAFVAASPARADSGWLTDPQTHCRVWDDDMQPGEAVHWSGACRNGIAEGPGITEWLKDGKLTTRIEGSLAAGHLEGRVLMNTAAGARIETEFHGGLIEGLDVITLADGTRTTLHYKQGKPLGRVQVVWPDGETLDGEVDENQQMHGVRTYPDGSKYDGDFKNYMPDGKGAFIRADGLRYKGDFVAGKMEGQGEVLYSDGGVYQGAMHDDKANGQGTMRGANGQIYRGFWVDGCLSQANSDNGMWAASGRSAASCGFN
jgi:hypothetical protein